MATKKKCFHCNEPTIPGLVNPLCQYHYDVMQFGQDWADKCRARGPDFTTCGRAAEKPEQVNPLVALVEALTVAQRKRDAEKWCFQSDAAVFASKPYARNLIDLNACSTRLLNANAAVDAIQADIDAAHKAAGETP